MKFIAFLAFVATVGATTSNTTLCLSVDKMCTTQNNISINKCGDTIISQDNVEAAEILVDKEGDEVLVTWYVQEDCTTVADKQTQQL
jgi:hypothetical protein